MAKLTRYSVIAIAIIAITMVALATGIRLKTPQGSWVCIKGQWEKQGEPKNPKPDFVCPLPPSENKEQTGTSVKLYFANTVLDPGMSDCGRMYAAERTIEPTDQPERKALELLLKGPTDEEKARGYLTTINSGVEINSFEIVDGVAKVDFDKSIEEAVGGSCRVTAIRAEITETLKQFENVKDVVISVEGRTEDILQP